jgi:CheY-like chemotaxis protein
MANNQDAKFIAIVDDDGSVQSHSMTWWKRMSFWLEAFGSAEEFLESGLQRKAACLIRLTVDIRMPGMSGLEVQPKLKADRFDNPDHRHDRIGRCESTDASNEGRRCRVPGETVRRSGLTQQGSRRTRYVSNRQVARGSTRLSCGGLL